MNKVQKVRGTRDLLPIEKMKFRFIEQSAYEKAQRYGFGEIETPIFEFSEVFHRSLGETSDAISKETYTFLDRGGESLTLRPEGTAGVARAFISEGMAQNLPLKFYYYGPMFRYERPQKGRYRQFYQLGVEALGFETPSADVEVLDLGWNLLKSLGFENRCILEINTLGDPESRKKYREQLVAFLLPLKNELSPDSQIRLDKNPLRILDSKDPSDQKLLEGAPQLEASLSTESKVFFEKVLKSLTDLGIPFKLNPKLVRGLDYYCHTVFEFTTTELGAQGALLSGGRYDSLIETLGGPKTPGVGWAAGVDRLAEMFQLPEETNRTLIAVLAADSAGEAEELKVLQKLRYAGFHAELILGGNFGKKMKKADKLKATHAIILGETELNQNLVSIKNLGSGEQQNLPLSQVIADLRGQR